MLLQVTPDGYKNMAVSRYPEMTQFVTQVDSFGSDNGTITVDFRAYGNAEQAKTIKIPLVPDTEKMESFQVKLHESRVTALKMPDEYNAWFSSCFGYQVVLVYLGPNKRAVMFQDMQPLEPDPLTRFLTKQFPFTGPYIERLMGLQQKEPWRITFADCAPYLITSKTSLEDVSSRLPDGEEMDMTKFRPNIVLSGAFEPYQEDYWGRIKINHKAELIIAHNCPRCKSINLDYDTGKPAVGASGDVLKKLQHDRRIDIGSKWSPVFGRYAFWDQKYADQVIKVGHKVNVTKVNDGLTVWSKFHPMFFS